MSNLVLLGYDDLVLLGFGRLGEVWRARHRSTGDWVVVRRLAEVDGEVLVRVRAAAAVVRALDTEHLVRLRETQRSEGEDLLVLDHAAGGALPTDRLLTPGQVVTVVAPLAAALAQAHAHGLVHGRLEMTSVLLTADGRPLLDGLGLGALLDGHDPTHVSGPAADVRALGAVALRLLTGQAPGRPVADLAPTAPVPMVAAVAAALDDDPAARPTAGAFAEALLASCAAVPLAVPAPSPGPQHRATVRRARVRMVLRSAALLAVVAAVVLLGVVWGHSTAGGPGGVPLAAVTSPAPAATASGWSGVLAGLDTSRARAFASGDVALLDAVYVAGSPVALADRAVLRALTERGATVTGLRHEVEVVTPRRATTDRVDLEVVASLASHVLIERAGPLRIAATAPVSRVVVLARTTTGWRIAEVR